MRNYAAVLGAAAAACAMSMSAQATDGYLPHGYGMKAKGMGGASVAVAQDAFGGANNPATMVFAGDRFDVGVDLFSPWRKAERTNASAFGVEGSASSDSNYFGIPELGYNRMIRPDLSLGISIFGNGGMNTDYPGGQLPSAGACAGFNPSPGPYNLLCGNGRLGVDLSQLTVAPTLSWRFAPNHSIGISPLFAYQRFKAEGVQAFDNPGLSTSPGNVTNRGYDNSTGWGARIGYFGQITPQLSIGATYQTRLSMSEFDKYRGLFAEQGGFDIPSNWAVGLAFRPDPRWLLALDYERVNYSDAKSVSNPGALLLRCANPLGPDPSTCLGGSNGAGFGWRDIDVFKVGAQYAVNANWTVRAGYNYSQNPIRSEDVTFNILAPGVMQHHVTLGATYGWANQELSGAFMYAFNNDVTGSSLMNNFFPPGTPVNMQEKIQMYEWSLGIQYSIKF